MPAGRQRVIQSAFANGVISPRVLGRVDQEKYRFSAEVLQNMIVLPQGAIKRRPGTQYVADAMGESRLIPFVFSPGEAYILELGDQAIRFFYADNTSGPWTIGQQIKVNGVPLTLTTPYDTSSMSLWDIQFAQQGDIVYFFHQQYPVQKLMRFGSVGPVPGPNDTNWRWLPVTFDCPPTDQFDQDISLGVVTLTPTGSTVAGAMNVPFAASAAGTFLDGDVGKYIVVGTALAKITSTTQSDPNGVLPNDPTGTTAYATIINSFFTDNTIAAGQWLMRGSPSAWGSYGNVLANGDPNTGGPGWISTAQYGIGLTENFQTFRQYPGNGNPPVHASSCFRPSDVGRYISADGCIGQIISVVSDHQASVQYLSVPEDTFVGDVAGVIRVSPVAPGAWTIEDPAWGTNGVRGYPSVGAFFQGRLYVAATQFQPKTFWGSQSDNFENFAKGGNAGDGLEYTISGDGELAAIKWLAGTPVQGNLAIETESREYIASGGGGSGIGGEGITPTSIQVTSNSAQGGCNIRPILSDNKLVYFQRYHTKVYELAYNIYQASFASRDLSLFAEHLTHAGIKEAAYQPIPYKIIWMVTYDGRLLSCTYDSTQDVLAWAEHRTGYADNGYGAVGTGDSFISVASIPNPSTELLQSDGTPIFAPSGSATYASDIVWVVVKRLRGGQTVYTIEMLNENLLVDCSSQNPNTQTGPFTSVTDTNLAGRVVAATGVPFYATKNYFPFDTTLLDDFAKPMASSLGVVPLLRKASSITSLGLPYRPLVLSCRPEIANVGTIQGTLQMWSDFFIRVFNSLGLIINGQRTDHAQDWETYVPVPTTPADTLEPGQLLQGENLDGSFAIDPEAWSDEVAPKTHDIRAQGLGWDRQGRVLITQYQPLPLTILATFGILNFGDM